MGSKPEGDGHPTTTSDCRSAPTRIGVDQNVLAVDLVVEHVEPIARLRLCFEIQLSLQRPDLIRCCQAYRQSSILGCFKSAPEVGVLPSAGIPSLSSTTTPSEPCEGYRQHDVGDATSVPHGPPPNYPVHPSSMPCPLPQWTGLGASVGCLPIPLGPSPYLRRVGVHDVTFEACSGFTRITACRIAQPPKAAISWGSSPDGCPSNPLVSYQNLPTTSWVVPTSTGQPRRWGALRNPG
jgi:hypothetical protein